MGLRIVPKESSDIEVAWDFKLSYDLFTREAAVGPDLPSKVRERANPNIRNYDIKEEQAGKQRVQLRDASGIQAPPAKLPGMNTEATQHEEKLRQAFAEEEVRQNRIEELEELANSFVDSEPGYWLSWKDPTPIDYDRPP